MSLLWWDIKQWPSQNYSPQHPLTCTHAHTDTHTHAHTGIKSTHFLFQLRIDWEDNGSWKSLLSDWVHPRWAHWSATTTVAPFPPLPDASCPAFILHSLRGCYPVTRLCPTLCNPMDCSMPGFPVLHHLPEFAQTHVHLSWWCLPTISSSVNPFSFSPQSLPASRSFPMSQLFASGG